MHLYSQADIRQLRKTFSSERFVIVHEPRLFERVSWIVKTQQSREKPNCHYKSGTINGGRSVSNPLP
jgi:hypothetical protein